MAHGDYVLINGVYRYQLPEPPQFESEILFAGEKIKDQYWDRSKVVPSAAKWKAMSAVKKGDFIEREVDYLFESGRWMANKGNLIYLPPDYLFILAYWQMKDGEYADFRISQYHEQLFEIFAESIPNCIGTVGFKKRRDGRTTRRMARKAWKAIQPKYANGWFGMQSKTGSDAKDVCWETFMAGWRGLPSWLKPDQSGTSDPKKKLELRKPATRLSRSNISRVQEDTDTGLNTTIDYRDTTADAYDGQETIEITLDEYAKWKKADVVRAFTTYNRCVWKDGKKVGHIHLFSSPSQSLGKEHDNSVKLWNMGDPEKSITYDEEGNLQVLKKSWFILRMFTGATEGYGGACDKYGHCDSELAREMIQEELDNAEPEMRKELARQMPFSIEDVLANAEDMIFENGPEMLARKQLLEKSPYRPHPDPSVKEPKYVFGNLEWKRAQEFTEVEFRPSRNQDDFSFTGRFCFPYLPHPDQQNRIIKKRLLGRDQYKAPDDSEHVIGIDPYDYRRTESNNFSEGSMLGIQALDFHGLGRYDRFNFAYLFRPPTPNDFYMDALKAAWFHSARIQVESKNKNILDFAEDNGCMDLFLPKNMSQPKSEHKGNATTSTLIDEMCSLLANYYGNPENLEDFMLDMVLGDNLVFNPLHTLKAHMTMAQGQALLGATKVRLLARKKRKISSEGQGKQMAKSLLSMYNLHV